MTHFLFPFPLPLTLFLFLLFFSLLCSNKFLEQLTIVFQIPLKPKWGPSWVASIHPPHENQPKTGFLQLVHWWVVGQTGPHGPDANKAEELVTISTHGSKKSAVDGYESECSAFFFFCFSATDFLVLSPWQSMNGGLLDLQTAS